MFSWFLFLVATGETTAAPGEQTTAVQPGKTRNRSLIRQLHIKNEKEQLIIQRKTGLVLVSGDTKCCRGCREETQFPGGGGIAIILTGIFMLQQYIEGG